MTKSWFAVYESPDDSDFECFDSFMGAEEALANWLELGFMEGLNGCRAYIASVDSGTVPNEYNDDWSFWNYSSDEFLDLHTYVI